MQGSQDELKNVLQEKLLEYEVGVSRASRDFIFANIAKPVRTGFNKKMLYSVALLLSLSSYFVYENAFSDNNSKTGPAEPEVVDIASEIIPATVQPHAGQGIIASSNKNKMSDHSSAIPVDESPALPNDARSEMPREQTLELNEIRIADESHSIAAARIVENSDSVHTVTEDKSEASVVPEVASAVIVQESARKIRFNVSVMPLLAFSQVIPNARDGATLSGFSSPGSLSPSRLGARVGFSIDYETKGNRFLYAGLSYFNYNTAFTYHSDESVGDIASTNVIDQRISGFGLSAGARYPLKISARKRHFITGGVEAQLLTGQRPGLTSPTQLMMNVGYAREVALSKGFIRFQPTVSYSLTTIQYPGLRTHPYWVGIDVSYVWSR